MQHILTNEESPPAHRDPDALVLSGYSGATGGPLHCSCVKW